MYHKVFHHSTRALRVIAFLCILTLSGCCHSKQYKQFRVSNQGDVGGVHVAVTSVGDWDSYRKSMQPTFEIDEDEALKEIVPTTMILERAVRDFFATKAKIAPPQSTLSLTETVTETTGEESTIAKTTERKKLPGDISAISSEGISAGAPPGTPAIPEDEQVRVDPMLKYDTATALLQHIELLNRDFLNASLRKNWQAYVVRIQISLQPLARNMPYDAYTTISFFSDAIDPPADEQYLLSANTGNTSPSTCDLPVVVPLLVTNNMEAAMRASAVETIRQYGLSLLFMIKGFGGVVDLDKDLAELEKVLGRDYNSLLSVARVTDNSFRVRLGAMRQSTASFATVPRAHTVTVLLLVPPKVIQEAKQSSQNQAMMNLIAKTSFVDAESGKELPFRQKSSLKKKVVDIVEYRGLKAYGINAENLADSAYFVYKNDFEGFDKHFKAIYKHHLEEKLKISPDDARLSVLKGQLPSLWIDLVQLKVGSQYDIASFEVPILQDPDIDPASQTALLLDDGATLTTTLLGGKGLDPLRMSGTLTLTITSKNKEYVFVADDISTDSTGKVSLSFPSPSKWGLEESFKDSGNSILLAVSDKKRATPKIKDFSCIYLLKPKPPKERITLVPGVEKLICNDDFKCPLGLTFAITDKKTKFSLKIDGAGVDISQSQGVDSKDVQNGNGVLKETETPGEFLIQKSGTPVLQLIRLTPGARATLNVKDDKGKTEGLPKKTLPIEKQT